MSTTTIPSGEELLSEILGDTKTADPDLKEETESEEEPDLDKIRQTAPPKKGLCRRCGANKPINRLMLCYPCWVKTNLEENGWREGMPHPDSCRCEGLGKHTSRKSEGN